MALVDEVAQSKTRQGEDNPHVQAEVIQGKAHGLADRLCTHRFCVLHGHVDDVVHRLGHTVEHQHGAEATGEEHRKPGQGSECRLLALHTQAHAAEAGDEENDEEQEGQGDAADVQPVEVLQQPVGAALQGFCGPVLEDDRVANEGNDEAKGNPED